MLYILLFEYILSKFWLFVWVYIIRSDNIFQIQYISSTVPGAMLMAMFIRGLTDDETICLTKELMLSGITDLEIRFNSTFLF